MNWLNFALEMGISSVFALLAAGVIPAERYQQFRKLAVRILAALPPDDAVLAFNEAMRRGGGPINPPRAWMPHEFQKASTPTDSIGE